MHQGGGYHPQKRGLSASLPSDSNKGANKRLPRDEGQCRPCPRWGGPCTPCWAGGGWEAAPTTRKPAPPRPPLSAEPWRLQHHGQLRAGGAGPGLARAGGSFTCTVRPETPQHSGEPPVPSCPGPPPIFFPSFFFFFSGENASRNVRQPLPLPIAQVGGTPPPPPTPPRSSPPSRCPGAQPPAGVGRARSGRIPSKEGPGSVSVELAAGERER